MTLGPLALLQHGLERLEHSAKVDALLPRQNGGGRWKRCKDDFQHEVGRVRLAAWISVLHQVHLLKLLDELQEELAESF